jgi:lactoylglutathione lyase
MMNYCSLVVQKSILLLTAFQMQGETMKKIKLDGFGIFVKDMPAMVKFYRDVLGFEIKEDENTTNVFLEKDGTLFLLYRRTDFEKMTDTRFNYAENINGHFMK